MDTTTVKLIQFEQENKWKEAVQYLRNEWQQKPMDVMKLIRLIGECWYIMVMWDCCIPIGSVSFEECESTLFKAIDFGKNHFQDNAKYLCIIGYIYTLTPYLFLKYDSDNETIIEQKGRNFLCSAKALLPQDPICSILHSGFFNDIEQHRILQQELLPALKRLQWDNSVVSQYFYNILMPK